MMRYRIRALTAVAILTIATNAWADNAVTRWVEQALQTVRVQNGSVRQPRGSMPW